MKKAFDTVPHDVLLSKLENYGIQNETLECLAMSCVTQDQNGDIYFGTGEGFYFFFGEGVGGIPGEGIYKSSDNGETFE